MVCSLCLDWELSAELFSERPHEYFMSGKIHASLRWRPPLPVPTVADAGMPAVRLLLWLWWQAKRLPPSVSSAEWSRPRQRPRSWVWKSGWPNRSYPTTPAPAASGSGTLRVPRRRRPRLLRRPQCRPPPFPAPPGGGAPSCAGGVNRRRTCAGGERGRQTPPRKKPPGAGGAPPRARCAPSESGWRARSRRRRDASRRFLDRW